jgi:hypothetical protein
MMGKNLGTENIAGEVNPLNEGILGLVDKIHIQRQGRCIATGLYCCAAA